MTETELRLIAAPGMIGLSRQSQPDTASSSCLTVRERAVVVSFEVAAKGPQDRASNHQFFVRADDANRGPAGVRGNRPRSLRIARRIQLNAEEAQPLTDARADEWRVLADASWEDERLQSPERSGEGSDPLLHLITKQRHGFCRPYVPALFCEQVAHVGACSGNYEQPRFVLHH